MSDGRRDDDAIEGVGWMIGGGLAFVAATWIVPASVVLQYGGALPRLSIFEAVSGALRVLGGGYAGNPAAAYPPAVQHDMPDATGWWGATAWTALILCALVAAALRHLEPAIARERLGRRPFDWRGARPRTWARPRDLRLPSSDPGGFSVGQLDGRKISTDEQAHIAVIAPTRAGKTTRCVIPWMLEHRGPVLVTSTKKDVLEAAVEANRPGRIWVFDPFGEDSMLWSPLYRCDSWPYALRQAQWLADASTDGDSEISRYWRGEAAKLLAPLIHAAALAGRSMAQVLAWLDEQDVAMPEGLLQQAGAAASRRQLDAVANLDPRNRGTTYMSAGSVLAAYRHPDVVAPKDSALTAGQVFTPDAFVGSAHDALFIVAAERDQQLLAPLVVSLISSVVHEAIDTGRFRDGDDRLRLLLDEAANIAPLPELPRLLSQAAGHGIRVATIWQSIAQLNERHGRAADTVLANSTAKLVMGPISDHATRRFAEGLLERPDRETGAASAASLQQLERGRAVVLTATRLPAVVSL